MTDFEVNFNFENREPIELEATIEPRPEVEAQFVINAHTAVATWGSITGLLSNQTDLQNALDGKADKATTINGYPLNDNISLKTSDLNNDSGYITLEDISSNATGLSYDNTTGIFSLEEGYEIPLSSTLNTYITKDVDNLTYYRKSTTQDIIDNELSTRITNEVTARTNADNQLSNRINTEITNRNDADTALQQNIDAEILARSNADTLLSNRITLVEDIKDVIPTEATINNKLADKNYVDTSIGKGDLIIQKNNANIGVFNANSLVNKSINIDVPTKTSELTNDANFIDLTDLSSGSETLTYNNTTGVISVTPGYSITTSIQRNQIETNADNISDMQDLIPNQASSSNQLADKDFVNSTIQTGTANFRGNWATWADVPIYPSEYPEDYSGVRTPSTNDYMVIENPSDYAPLYSNERPYPVDFCVYYNNILYKSLEEISIPEDFNPSKWEEVTAGSYAGTWRFKYVGVWSSVAREGWKPEYQVNEEPFTINQWKAINSGVTSDDIPLIHNAIQPNDNVSELTNDAGYIDKDVNNLTYYTTTTSLNDLLDQKQDNITGGATTILSDNLTVSRALISNENGKVDVSEVTSTELGYLDGATSNIQTQLDNKLNKKPDGTNDLISNNKLTTGYFPDFVLGQVLYAGNFVPSTAVATLTTNGKEKLGTTSNTITLTNDTTAITGYEANEGCYYICSADGTFASISLLTGDWLISTGSAWTKIDNTDAVTGVKGNAESTYRIGNVNITADNVLPTQTSNSGKFLTTDGTTASWSDVPVTDVQVNSTSVVTNGVANIPIGSSSKLGVYKAQASWGIDVYAGILYCSPAQEATIDRRNNGTSQGIEVNYQPITPYKLDYAVKKSITTSNQILTSTEKTNVCSWIGAQETLVSGTNIKTINNNSILGDGNLNIDSLPSQTGQNGKYLTTDGSTASWATITIPVVEEYTASEVETLWGSI